MSLSPNKTAGGIAPNKTAGMELWKKAAIGAGAAYAGFKYMDSKLQVRAATQLTRWMWTLSSMYLRQGDLFPS
jgi:hypothetical protein